MIKKLTWPTAAVAIALIASIACTAILAPEDVRLAAVTSEGIFGVLISAAMRSLRGGQ